MKYLLLILSSLGLKGELDLTIPIQPAVYVPSKEFILNLGDYNEPPTRNQIIFFWTINTLDVYTTYEGLRKCIRCKETNFLLPDKPQLEELILQKAIVGTYIARNSSEGFINVINVSLGLVVISNYKYIK